MAPLDTHDAAVDGRHARREKNREAVVDALLGFYREGRLQPSTDEIAERAGISARSLFRYFDDVDALCRVAISRQMEQIAPHFTPHLAARVDTTLDLPTRADSFVHQRLDLYDAMSWVGVVARTREHVQPLIADELRRVRALLRDQIRQVFAPELDRLDPAEAHRRLVAIDVMTSFEAHRLMLDDQHLDRDTIHHVLVDSLVRHLTPHVT